jgi:serine phosphatase RsbU (regulator of sigma subunit)/anti-sigma regulatory factor (Ser/Thr protein kinase)
MIDPEPEDAPVEAPAAQGGQRVERPAEPGAGDAILGATLETLKRAAHGVEIERRVAETLQRSLLPRLPEPPGLRLAARYRPGSAETRIGGDWYDAIQLPGGRIGITIGDVVGRGVEAAARMAHLQSALRAYALESLRPALVLERMNSFVLDGEQGGMVTLLYGIVDADGCTMQLASAGHPPPLVLCADGTTTFAEAPAGSPLGVTRFPSYEESVTTLDPWSTVLLYTDGIVEGPELPLGKGLERLRRAAEGAPREPEGLCRAMLASIDERAGSRGDDLALLAVQLNPPGESLALTLPVKPGSLAQMRRALAQWLRLAGAAEDEIYETLVACGEACANTVAHAHPAVSDSTFQVRATRDACEIEITVRDSGSWRPHANGLPGRGLALMRALTDSVDIERGPPGTTVILRRRLRGAGEA